MARNSDLNKANRAKKDEFYTQLTDIEKEMKYYTDHFKGKVIFLNCDDPEESNFWKYFQLNFYQLGLKKLISTHFEESKPSYKMEIVSTDKEDGQAGTQMGIPNYVKTQLTQNGDFRSPECIEILKEADIVITNPPFSLFREYIAQLFEHNKKFIIIGNINAIKYKEVFPYLQQNKVWLGASIHSGDREFAVPDSYPLEASGYRIDENGRKYIRVKGVRWITNIDYSQRHEDLLLYQTYSPEKYKKYENFDAINVDNTADIPMDYYGIMGVPITFIDKYNPDQFEIIGVGIAKLGLSIGIEPYKPEHKKYRKEVQKCGAVDGDLYMIEDGVVKVPYARILIRRKEQNQ